MSGICWWIVSSIVEGNAGERNQLVASSLITGRRYWSVESVSSFFFDTGTSVRNKLAVSSITDVGGRNQVASLITGGSVWNKFVVSSSITGGWKHWCEESVDVFFFSHWGKITLM